MNVITSIVSHARSCATCGAEFTHDRRNPGQRWCSNSCANKALALARSDVAWSNERIAELTKLWASGMSAGTISLKLYGTKTHRNAVLGKLHRLGIPKLDTTELALRNAIGAKARTKHAPKPYEDGRKGNGGKHIFFPRNRMERRVAPPEPPPHGSKTLMELGLHECKFPYGNRAPYLFCSQPTEEEHSYCGAHERICFQPLMGRR